MINNATKFAEYGNKNTKVSVYYIDNEGVKAPAVCDVMYVKRTHGIHHVESRDKNVISYFEYSIYKMKSNKLDQELKFDVANDDLIDEERLDHQVEDAMDTEKTTNANMFHADDNESETWTVINYQGDSILELLRQV